MSSRLWSPNLGLGGGRVVGTVGFVATVGSVDTVGSADSVGKVGTVSTVGTVVTVVSAGTVGRAGTVGSFLKGPKSKCCYQCQQPFYQNLLKFDQCR